MQVTAHLNRIKEQFQLLAHRTRLVKLAVKVTVSARRIYLSFTDSFPLRETFLKALGNTA